MQFTNLCASKASCPVLQVEMTRSCWSC